MTPVRSMNEDSNHIQNAVPARGRYSSFITSAARKVSIVALSALALYAASNVPSADAGPVTYGICVAALAAASHGFFMPSALFKCAYLLGPWYP